MRRFSTVNVGDCERTRDHSLTITGIKHVGRRTAGPQ